MIIHRRSVLSGTLGAVLLSAAGCATGKSFKSSNATSDSADADLELRAAFQFAYPIYEYARVAQNRTQALKGQAGRLNQLRHRSVLMDHTSRTVTGPNVDTIYSSAFLDLSGGPLKLTAPTDDKRYFSIAFMNILTDNFAYIGTRATGGDGGAYYVVGPQWDGVVPENTLLIRSDSNDVWMLGRTLVDGLDDLQDAIALQTQIKLEVPFENVPAKAFRIDASGTLTGAKFLAIVNDMLSRSPDAGGELARSSSFKSLGIGETEISDDVLARWDAFIPTGLEELRDIFLYRDLIIDGWAYQEEGVGEFGSNDELRAAVALGGLAALGEDEAMYFHANLDPSGKPLQGTRTYRWTVPAGGVPADAFWSLTMYETYPDGRHFLVDNPLGRYSIGDRTEGLKVEPDGSFEILIQSQVPPLEKQSNWLPAPSGRFRLALRAYLPREELKSRTWTVPPLIAD